jgi:hypothetical protein
MTPEGRFWWSLARGSHHSFVMALLKSAQARDLAIFKKLGASQHRMIRLTSDIQQVQRTAESGNGQTKYYWEQ